MNTKLTLSMEPSVIERAKQAAHARNVGDFPAGTLPILTPDEFLALLDHAGV